MDRHIVYAVTVDLARHRLSEPLDWDTAQRRWDRLDRARLRGRRQSIDGVPVSYFAVRSAANPEWPSVLATRRCVETEPDRPHRIVLESGIHPLCADARYRAVLTSERGTVRSGGSSPFRAIGEACREARRAAII